MKKLFCIVWVMSILCFTACTTPKNTSPKKNTIKKVKAPQDFFEPLRKPYLEAFTAARMGNKYKTKQGVMTLLQVLETLRAHDTASWPEPYNEEVQLTQKALELMINQVKVVGVLNITGQHKEAYTTLLDVGYVLKRVRRHLGVVRPTDRMLSIHKLLDDIKREMETPVMNWQTQEALTQDIGVQIKRLSALPESDWPVVCKDPNKWQWILALERVVKQKERTALQQQWVLARRQFYETFSRCG